MRRALGLYGAPRLDSEREIAAGCAAGHARLPRGDSAYPCCRRVQGGPIRFHHAGVAMVLRQARESSGVGSHASDTGRPGGQPSATFATGRRKRVRGGARAQPNGDEHRGSGCVRLARKAWAERLALFARRSVARPQVPLPQLPEDVVDAGRAAAAEAAVVCDSRNWRDRLAPLRRDSAARGAHYLVARRNASRPSPRSSYQIR